MGGAIAQGAAWEWIFWLNVPIGLAAIPLVLRRIPESYGRRARLDFMGLALVTGAALGVVWALVRGNAAGWGSVEVVGALAAGIVLAIAFVAWELRAPEPMLPMGFFRSRGFAAGNASVFFLIASLFGAAFFLAQFLQTSLGYGPLGTGLRLMPWTATLFFVAPIAGSLVNRVGERPLIVGGLLLQAIGMAWIGLIASPSMDYVDMVPALVLAGTRGLDGHPGHAERGHERGAGDRGREGLGDVQHAAPARRRVRHRAARGRVHRRGRLRVAAGVHDGFAPAIGVTAGLALIGAVAGLGLPRVARTRPPGRGGDVMRRVVVRYRVRPDRVEENEQLVRAVYEELAAVQPEGLRYATVKLDDGVTFVHVAVHETENPLPGLASFRAFTEGVAERCDEPPVVSTAELVGSYRLLD